MGYLFIDLQGDVMRRRQDELHAIKFESFSQNEESGQGTLFERRERKNDY